MIEKDENRKVKSTTMAYWFQKMFLDSDGEITIADYLNILIKLFQDSKMEIPADLDVFITETLFWSLKTDLNAIGFTDFPIEFQRNRLPHHTQKRDSK